MAPLASYLEQEAALYFKDFDQGRLDLIHHSFSNCGPNGVDEGVSEGSTKQEGVAMTEKVLALEADYIAY